MVSPVSFLGHLYCCVQSLVSYDSVAFEPDLGGVWANAVEDEEACIVVDAGVDPFVADLGAYLLDNYGDAEAVRAYCAADVVGGDYCNDAIADGLSDG